MKLARARGRCVLTLGEMKKVRFMRKYLKTAYSGQLLSVGISTSPEYFKPDLLDLGTFNMV